MADEDLASVSTYFLLLELLNGGETGLIQTHRPLSDATILQELKNRSNLDFASDKSKWARWFIESGDHGTDIERSNLLIFVTTLESMERIWSRVTDAGRKT
jgi:hypothetical protein